MNCSMGTCSEQHQMAPAAYTVPSRLLQVSRNILEALVDLEVELLILVEQELRRMEELAKLDLPMLPERELVFQQRNPCQQMFDEACEA